MNSVCVRLSLMTFVCFVFFKPVSVAVLPGTDATIPAYSKVSRTFAFQNAD